MTTSITGQGITTYKVPDDALSNESKNAVQNKVINEEVTDLQNAISQLGDIAAFKTAILQIAQKVAYIDEHGQDYYDDLYAALYPSVGLASISAVYTQSGTVYDTDTLDSLKSDLVVTANYVDGSTATIPGADYTLSGTLVEGTSTITVSYGGKTDTFTVTVTNNTEAQIAQENYMFALRSGAIVAVSKQNAGITIKYGLDSATTILHPAGVIVNDGLFGASDGCLAIYNNGAYVNYVDEIGRWGQAPAQSYTEYNSKSWTVQPYNQIAFSVDIRYLDDSYMYDYTSGKVFFAGKNTPYFGMSNISEAQ